ncbi:hypothetical protein [Kocuria sp.]|uniref:hypothetical protein n=1 Tax=Kocuria sp. TaxID=1871328 RepID=UPI0026DD52D7|nr:hypothetical protein [Kocuria sp.]MDO4918416.1 hypothetical protein [Kocuria sp.]
MPTPAAPRQRTTSRRRAAVVLAAVALVVVLVVAVVLLVVKPFTAAEVPSTDCTRYGLSAEDSRAHPHTVTRATQPTDEDQTQAGALGRLDQSFTDRGVTSQYHVVDGGVDTSKPVGLVVDLHGDGGAEFTEPGGRTTCLAAVAASHNALLVVPLTPDCHGDCTWWRDMAPNLRWLRALTEKELLRNLPVQKDRITWMGYSGGAEMLSYGVLSDARDLVTGGAVMVGGGGAPSSLGTAPTAEQKRQLRMWWFTGAQDDGAGEDSDFDAVTAATDGQHFYEARGFTRTRLELLPGHTHFDMPDASILDELLGAEQPPASPTP